MIGRHAPLTMIAAATFTRDDEPSDPDGIEIAYGVKGGDTLDTWAWPADDDAGVEHVGTGIFEVRCPSPDPGTYVVRFVGTWEDEEGDVVRTIEREWVAAPSGLG